MATNYYKLPTVDPDSTLSFPDAVNGLANATDAVLHGIQSGFERKEYTLPTATSERLGGVRVGRGFDVYSDGLLTTQVGAYELPPAGANKLGGVLIGKNVTVDDAGRIGIGAGAMSGLEANENTLKGLSITTEKLADYAVDDSQIDAKLLSTLKAPPTLWKNAQRTAVYALVPQSLSGTYPFSFKFIKITKRVYCIVPYQYNSSIKPSSFAAGTHTSPLYKDYSGSTAFAAGELGTGKLFARETVYSLTTQGTYTPTEFHIDVSVDLDASTATIAVLDKVSTGDSNVYSVTPGYFVN